MFTLNVKEDLSLKLLEKKDAKELFSLVDESRDYLREWLPWVEDIKQEKDYGPVIDMWLQQFSSQEGLQAGILYKGELAGVAGFNKIDWSNRKTSIGYWLSEKYQGRGIVTTVVKALIDCAFAEYHLNRVEIECGVDNEKSRAIPERIGFRQEGIIREAEYLYDHFHDLALYSILAKEWKALS
ncbi:GNAT family N-acetyltransferase [Halobacillus naozhouensis]|uniref:GNAT family protein n=1 Tax=Halobacillus naozhouensis TaxID=554880 RepID=A0ABY8J0I0_9BACI|nr:GNAT family protein [Halobacillus naozhouensis]WFT76003.1 GNAT family protein [Halobacillus naozhouensis]